jgi:hypothetical protein
MVTIYGSTNLSFSKEVIEAIFFGNEEAVSV